MQPTGTAERDQHMLARVGAPPDRNRSQGLCHMFVRDCDHVHCRAHPRRPHRIGEGIDHGVSGGDIQTHLAAQECIGLQTTEHQVGVGDRGPGSAPSITGRPRFGACRLRADLQHAAGIDPCDRAAAGADGVHVNHRHRNREAPDMPLGGQAWLAVDQGNIGRGTPHIEGQQTFPV